MGTWGVSIFADDTACDVRDDFRELAGEELSPTQATRKLLKDYDQVVRDPDDGPLFWIALAVVQCRTGRLLASVRNKALRIIDTGAELCRWEDEGDSTLVERRRQVLLKLRAELTAPPKPPVRIPKVFRYKTQWKVGHVISYRLQSGRLVLFRVLHIDKSPKGDCTPIVEVCDWCGKRIPDARAIQRLPYRPSRYSRKYSLWTSVAMERKHGSKFAVYSQGPRDTPGDGIAVVATGLKVRKTNIIDATYFGGWKHLDEFLLREYRLK